MIHYKVKSVRRTLVLGWAASVAFFSTWIGYCGIDVPFCCCETKSTLMPSVRTQKKLLSDVRVLLRMIGCLSIRFVQTSSRTFKTFCCWVCFIVDDSIECLLLIIWIDVYSSYIFFVYSELILNYTSVNNVRCSYICSLIYARVLIRCYEFVLYKGWILMTLNFYE